MEEYALNAKGAPPPIKGGAEGTFWGPKRILGILVQCWAKSQEQCQPSGCIGTFAGQGGGMPELIPARLSYQQESSRLIFFQPASYIVF